MSIVKNHARDRRGFTLTEAAIVLGIVGLILGAVWIAAKSVYGNVSGNRAGQVLTSLVAEVRAVYNPLAQNLPSPGTVLSAGFTSQNSFPTSTGTVQAAIVGSNSILNVPEAFEVRLTNNALGRDNAGIGACNGLVQTARQMGASSGNAVATAAPVIANCTAIGTNPCGSGQTPALPVCPTNNGPQVCNRTASCSSTNTSIIIRVPYGM